MNEPVRALNESLTNPRLEVGLGPTHTPTGASLGYLAWERDANRIRYEDAQGRHQDGQEQDLYRRTAVKARAGVTALLEELAEQRGLAWSTIAAIVGVSVSALRKWRRGGAASPDNRRGLAQLAALVDLIEEYQITDPANWLEMPLALPPGYRVRPADLYRDGHIAAILDLASMREPDPARVLDEVRPGWRETRSDWEVADAPDGFKAIQQRTQ